MKKLAIAISFFGGLSLLAGVSWFLPSFITFHPDALRSVKRFMSIITVVWIGLLFITLVLSLSAIPLSSENDLSTAKALMRRGLWYVIPQLIVILVLLVGGLLLARDIARMGGH